MKLYATTTSERASKGQGGNKYLDIETLVEVKNSAGMLKRETLAKLAVIQDDNFYYLKLLKNLDSGGNDNLTIEKKAKRQKGD